MATEHRKKYMREWFKNNRDKKIEYSKKYYLKNKDKVKNRIEVYVSRNKDKIKVRRKIAHLKLKFNISLEDYNLMLLKQKGVCAICFTKKKDNGSDLHVDHCHKTGKIRGLLCYKCNMGLGYFQDEYRLLKKAINYLQKYVPK